MRTRLQRNYDIAADGMAAVLRARDAAERKNGFNPAQPRTAAGNGRESGRWLGDGLGVAAGHVVGGLNHAADMVSRGMGRALAPISRQIDEAIAHAPPKVKAFLSENRAAIESTRGGLQAAGGVPQIVEGAELIGAGAATFPEGAPLIVVGGAMVAHGYDDWKTGLRALATGQAEPGGFYNLLRDSGFDDQAAKIALATTAGLLLRRCGPCRARRWRTRPTPCSSGRLSRSWPRPGWSSRPTGAACSAKLTSCAEG